MKEIQEELAELRAIMREFSVEIRELSISVKGLTDWTKFLLEGALVESFEEQGVEVPESVDIVSFVRSWGTSPN